MTVRRQPGRRAVQTAIRLYQLSLSSLVGSQCRHWPTCSAYTSEAVGRHGVWAGGWMGFSRICRCGPFGTHGIDLVPSALPHRSAWYRPWRYGRWRGTKAVPDPVCEACETPLPDMAAPDLAAPDLAAPAYLHRAQE